MFWLTRYSFSWLVNEFTYLFLYQLTCYFVSLLATLLTYSSLHSRSSIHLLVTLLSYCLLCLFTRYFIYILVTLFINSFFYYYYLILVTLLLTHFIFAQASSVTLHSLLYSLLVTFQSVFLYPYRCFYLCLICSFSILLISLYIPFISI